MDTIPLVDLVAQYRTIQPQVLAAVADVFERMHLVPGEHVPEFEREFAAYCGVDHAITCSNGTSAISIALRALEIGAGDEVIVPAHTFFATAEAPLLVGARPVFADVEPVTRAITAATIEPLITPRTRAIIVVHIHGQLAQMDGILALAQRHDLRVIEDAAQAHGAERDGVRAGGFGDVGTFSFYPSKNLGAYGEAGALVTRHEDVARRARALRDHGSLERYRHSLLAGNDRMDEIQAAVLRIKLAHLDEWNERRRTIAAMYDEALAGVPVELPRSTGPRAHIYHHYALLAEDRDALAAALRADGVGTGVHYPVPCHRQPVAEQIGTQPALPQSEHVAAQVLSLPMYAELTEDQIARVVTAVRRHYGVDG